MLWSTVSLLIWIWTHQLYRLQIVQLQQNSLTSTTQNKAVSKELSLSISRVQSLQSELDDKSRQVSELSGRLDRLEAETGQLTQQLTASCLERQSREWVAHRHAVSHCVTLCHTVSHRHMTDIGTVSYRHIVSQRHVTVIGSISRYPTRWQCYLFQRTYIKAWGAGESTMQWPWSMSEGEADVEYAACRRPMSAAGHQFRLPLCISLSWLASCIQYVPVLQEYLEAVCQLEGRLMNCERGQAGQTDGLESTRSELERLQRQHKMEIDRYLPVRRLLQFTSPSRRRLASMRRMVSCKTMYQAWWSQYL